jgi:hypothetical protein
MNRDEVTRILEMVSANYPKTPIKDPSRTAEAWEMALGEFSAEAVGKAVRLHMNESPFFPTPADIRKQIIRASLLFTENPSNRIEASKTDKRREDYYLEELCKFVGLGHEPQDDADLLCEFLNYEK